MFSVAARRAPSIRLPIVRCPTKPRSSQAACMSAKKSSRSLLRDQTSAIRALVMISSVPEE